MSTIMADATLAPFDSNHNETNSSTAWTHANMIASNREYPNTTTTKNLDDRNTTPPTDRDINNANNHSVTAVQASFLVLFVAGFPMAYLLMRFCGRNQQQQQQLSRQAVQQRRKAARAKKVARQRLIEKHLIVRQWQDETSGNAFTTNINNNRVSADCEQRTVTPRGSPRVITRSARSLTAIRSTEEPVVNAPIDSGGGDGDGSHQVAIETTLVDGVTASTSSQTTRIAVAPTVVAAPRSLARRWTRRTSTPRAATNTTASASSSPDNGNSSVALPSGPSASNNNTSNDDAGNPAEPGTEREDDEASVASSSSSSSASLQKPCCAICWSHFTRQQWVCQSNNPVCAHVFHRDCMAAWLLKHEECPMCRQAFLLIPPEQEPESVVALADSEPDSEQEPDTNATTDVVVDVEAAEAISIPTATTANVSTPTSSQNDETQSISSEQETVLVAAVADFEQGPDPNATMAVAVDVEAARTITIPTALSADRTTTSSQNHLLSLNEPNDATTTTAMERQDNIHGDGSTDSNAGGSSTQQVDETAVTANGTEH